MATILATYVDSTSFTVVGERDQDFALGTKVILAQGGWGTSSTAVAASSYAAGTGLTTVTVQEAVVTSYLASVRRGPTSAETEAAHDHLSWASGGPIPAARLSDAQVDALISSRQMISWVGDWADDLVDVPPGGLCSHRGTFFLATVLHDTSAADEPGVGLYWADYWECLTGPAAPPIMTLRGAWELDLDFMIGNVVSHESHLYAAILAHTSSAADEPGVGIYEGDYWTLLL